MANPPRNHHYVPQFFLRNFAEDEQKKRIFTVGKNGRMATWAERSIEGLGYERDFYVHMKNGIPTSLEIDINRHIESPLSRSETWRKISTGNTDQLDYTDRAILYSLIRHFEARTPHYQATLGELAQMAADPRRKIKFSEDELEQFAFLRAHPEIAKQIFNQMAMRSIWNPEEYNNCKIMVVRSPIRLRSSSTPVCAVPIKAHPSITYPLPGITPFKLVLTLNPYTIACLILGNFDGAFTNEVMDVNDAMAYNRHFVIQFCKFEHVRHVITNRENIIDDMVWAPYDLVADTEKKITFCRRS